MAADIVILNVQESQSGFVHLRVIFWLAVANPYPNPGAASAYLAITTDANTTGVLAQIQAGTIVEEVNSFMFPQNWIATQWATAVEPLLLAYLNARKAARAGTVAALPDPGIKYKVVHDTVTGWSA